MKHTTLISLDSSTKATGYAIWKSGVFCEHGLIDLSNISDMNDRIKVMMEKIFKLLIDNDADIVVCEGVHVNRNLAVGNALNKIIGSIMGWCMYTGAFFYELGPTEWRKAIGMKSGRDVKREEYKQLSKEYVAEKFNVKDVTDDESDAICIGNAYINIFTGTQGD